MRKRSMFRREIGGDAEATSRTHTSSREEIELRFDEVYGQLLEQRQEQLIEFLHFF